MKHILLRGNVIKDIAKVLLVSMGVVLRLIVRWGKEVQVKLRKKTLYSKKFGFVPLFWSLSEAETPKEWF